MKSGIHGGHTGLVAVQCSCSGVLADRASVGSALPLHGGHSADEFHRSATVANTPTGHGVALRDAVDGDRAVVEPRTRRYQTAERFGAPPDVLVHVVGANDHLRVAQQHLAQGRQFSAGVGGAGGVGRAIQQQQAGARRDGRFQLGRRELVASLRARGHDDRHAICQQHHIGVGHPIGRWNDSFVARIQQGGAEVIEGLLGATGDQNLLARVIETVVTPELGDDGVLQFRGAIDAGIARLALANGGHTGIRNVGGGIEIRLADAQADDISARRLQLQHPGGEGEGGRGLDALNALGDGDGHGGVRKGHATRVS